MTTVPDWCTRVAAEFRAAEHTRTVPAQLENHRDAAIVHWTLRTLAAGGPAADALLETIDRERAVAVTG